MSWEAGSPVKWRTLLVFIILGFNYLLTPSVTHQLKGNIGKIYNIKEMSPVGNKGNNKIDVIPSVSTDALNASSMLSSRVTLCHSEILSIFPDHWRVQINLRCRQLRRL